MWFLVWFAASIRNAATTVPHPTMLFSSIWRPLTHRIIQQCEPETIATKHSSTESRTAPTGTNWTVCIDMSRCHRVQHMLKQSIRIDRWHAGFQLCNVELLWVNFGIVVLQVPERQRATVGMVEEQTKSYRIHEIDSHGLQRHRHRLESLPTWRHWNHRGWSWTETCPHYESWWILAIVAAGTVSCASDWLRVSTRIQ